MRSWEELCSDEKLLIVKSEIYTYLKNNNPSHWVNIGYLQKEYSHDTDGNKTTIYKVTSKALRDLVGIFTKKVKIRFLNSNLKERKKTVRKEKRECTLLNLMEA